MRVEPEQIQAICITLRRWGVEITHQTEQDLIVEFDTIPPGVDDWLDGKARRNDPITSHRAAKSNHVRRGTQRHRILLAYRDASEHGLTEPEVAQRTGIARGVSTAPRIAELIDMKFVRDTDRTRRTELKADALVRVITPAGLAELRRLDA